MIKKRRGSLEGERRRFVAMTYMRDWKIVRKCISVINFLRNERVSVEWRLLQYEDKKKMHLAIYDGWVEGLRCAVYCEMKYICI